MKKCAKLVVSLFVAIIMIGISSVSVFAQSTVKQYRYVSPKKEIYFYYLDEDNMPYQMINGKKVVLLLPLEHLKVTDENKLAELNFGFKNSNGAKSPPTTYVDISSGDSSSVSVSPRYSANVTFVNDYSSFLTSAIRVNTRHVSLRIKTESVKPTTLINKRVNFYLYWYSLVDDCWYQSSQYTAKNCNGTNGFGIQMQFSLSPYIRVDLSRYDAITSLTLKIWTDVYY